MKYISLSEEMLEQEAFAHFQNMKDTRTWNSGHGGVYIKAKQNDEPNKYLKNNHTFTIDNELLIKINPAWMTRQISEISNKNSKYLFKITSLNPINPNNKADVFETEALNFFEKNRDKIYYTNFEKDRYNFMGALEVKQSCLECHLEQGYKVGDIRGGRVSVPLTEYNQKISLVKDSSLILSIIIIIISVFILFTVVYFINSLYKRQNTIESLNANLEDKIKVRTKELEQNVQKLNELATVDFLTNIPNRRYFFDLGNKLFSLAKRDKAAFSLIIIDIDYFKKVNDNYGHFIGDEILKIVSKKIEKNIRTSDIAARIGGEEFVVLLNETTSEGAYIIAEKLRTIIKDSSYSHDKYDVSVTISLGISSLCHEKDEKIDDILIRADEALYSSKSNGRNKTTIK
jgi:diguanylate cyclase (GGDEF)-like protein